MTKDPYAENKILRQKLDEFMAQARQNEGKQRRFQSLELRLIGLSSLFDLIEALIYPDQTKFKWDAVTLLLLDPEYEIQRILEDEGVKLDKHPCLMFATDRIDLENLYPFSLFPTLGTYKSRNHSSLFPKKRKMPSSVALLPLVRHGKLIGSLNVGSFSSERFVRGVRTDFFEHLAGVVAICLENAANLVKLKRQGLTDTLTAINNRRFFDQRLGEEVNAAVRNKKVLSCMLLDVDFFKKVNDSYGHQTGDYVLREIAALIRAQMRGSDVLSRYGGEEFAALMSNTGEDVAIEVAERIRANIETHNFKIADDRHFNVTISIGIVTFDPEKVANASRVQGEYLVGQSDRALYDAKSQGRNKVVSAGQIVVQEDW